MSLQGLHFFFHRETHTTFPLSLSLSLSRRSRLFAMNTLTGLFLAGGERRSNPFFLFWRRGRKMVSLSRGEKKDLFFCPDDDSTPPWPRKKRAWERLYKSALEYWHWKIRKKNGSMLFYLCLHICNFVSLRSFISLPQPRS